MITSEEEIEAPATVELEDSADETVGQTDDAAVENDDSDEISAPESDDENAADDVTTADDDDDTNPPTGISLGGTLALAGISCTVVIFARRKRTSK